MGKKFANFGGVGGQNSPFSPGSSPNFGEGGGGGAGIDDFSGDASLDSIMCRSHKPDILGFERPLESLLENFHDNVEKDSEPYLLTFEERQKLNLKKKIRQKEHYLKELSDQDVHKEKMEKIHKKLHTVEDLLEMFRKNKDIDFTKNASYYRTKTAPPLVDEFLPTEEEYADEDNPLSLTNARLTQPWTGITPQYRPEDGVDKYVEELNNPHFPDMHAGNDMLVDIPDPQNDGPYQMGNEELFPEPSQITPESKNNNQPLEKKLEKLKKAPEGIGRLDPNMFGVKDLDKWRLGDWPERSTSERAPYVENNGLGDGSTWYSEKSNNPYGLSGLL